MSVNLVNAEKSGMFVSVSTEEDDLLFKVNTAFGDRRYQLLKKFEQPVKFYKPEVARKEDGSYVIKVPFDRLGKHRWLEIVTNTIDINYILGLLEEKLPSEMNRIPNCPDHLQECVKCYCKSTLSSVLGNL
jgi:hypothetical protein